MSKISLKFPRGQWVNLFDECPHRQVPAAQLAVVQWGLTFRPNMLPTNHWGPGRVIGIQVGKTVSNRNLMGQWNAEVMDLYLVASLVSHVDSLVTPGRCSNASMCLLISTKCFLFPDIVPLLYSVGAVRQEAIIWTNVDPEQQMGLTRYITVI